MKKLLILVSTILIHISLTSQVMKDSSDILVITDSKVERSVRQTTRPVEIINQATIEQYIGKDLSQLLEDQVGLSVNGGNSNPAAIKNIYLRGAAPGYTLILIDGIAATDASIIGSTIDLRLLDLNQIARIEVAKGSHSTLYGSDAIAGVINIITKEGGDNKIGVNVNASAGSYDTYDLGVSINGSTSALNYNVGYQYTESEGISEAFDPSPGQVLDFDKDGLEKEVVYANLKYNINDQLSIAPYIRFSSFQGGYDAGSFTDGTDTYDSQLANMGVRVQYQKDNFKLNAAYNNIEADRSFFTDFGDFIFNGNTQNADVFATLKKNNLNIILGINYQDASITDEGTTVINPSWNIFSPYANLIYLKNRFQIEGGLRYNTHSDFGDNINLGITPSLFVSDNLKFFTSYTTAFKAPALYELYGAFGANPNLQPQTSTTFELGSKYFYNEGDLAITYFNRNIEDVILFTSMYENLAEQKDQGIEITVNHNIDSQMDIQLSYTYLEGFALDNQGIETSNLFKRPGHQIGLVFNYQIKDQWNLRFINQWNSDRSDLFFDFNTFTSQIADLNAYLRSDISINFQAHKSIKIFGHINNLWDNDYFETFGFSTQGRNFRVGATWSL